MLCTSSHEGESRKRRTNFEQPKTHFFDMTESDFPRQFDGLLFRRRLGTATKAGVGVGVGVEASLVWRSAANPCIRSCAKRRSGLLFSNGTMPVVVCESVTNRMKLLPLPV